MRVFIAAAERLHVTNAAKQLNMTQSAASAAIAALEGHYGVLLFHRIGRNIALTEEGRLFLVEGKRLLEHALRVERALQDLSNLRRGALAIQASLTIASYILPALMHRFRTLHPAISLSLKIANTAQVAAAILHGEADIGFVEGEVSDAGLLKIRAGEDRLVLVVNPAHPWAQRRRVALEEFTDSAWVLREKGSGTRQVFEHALQRQGFDFTRLSVAFELPSNEAVRSAVEAGAGAAVISLLVAEASVRTNALVPIDMGWPSRPFFALCRNDHHRTKASEAFLHMLRGIIPAKAEQSHLTGVSALL
jgi:DNA-binding transcriptional LysR family regulator